MTINHTTINHNAITYTHGISIDAETQAVMTEAEMSVYRIAISTGLEIPKHYPLGRLYNKCYQLNSPSRILAVLSAHLSTSHYTLAPNGLNAKELTLLPLSGNAGTSIMLVSRGADWEVIADTDYEAQRLIQLAASVLSMELGLNVYAEHNGLEVSPSWVVHRFTLHVTVNTEQYPLAYYINALMA